MAAAAHVSVNVYGLAFGSVPFQNKDGNAAFDNTKIFPHSGVVSIPTDQVLYHPLYNGYQVTNLTGSFYVYSVIEVLPTGLANAGHATKYLSDQSVATLASSAG